MGGLSPEERENRARATLTAAVAEYLAGHPTATEMQVKKWLSDAIYQGAQGDATRAAGETLMASHLFREIERIARAGMQARRSKSKES